MEEVVNFRILEFYSGIGGMRYSLMKAGIKGEVVEAFDINDTANDVYQHNFNHRPFQAKREPLSFHNPSYNNKLVFTPDPLIMLESIKPMDGELSQDNGLEESNISCQPIKNFLEIEPLFKGHGELSFINEYDVSMVDSEDGSDNTCNKGCGPKDMESTTGPNKIVEEIERSDANKSPLDNYCVPISLIERWGSAMDIVFPDSKRCCCFTKSYHRYVKGTGSLLATSEVPQNGLLKKPDICSLKHLGLRYFTPREVANLHSFPEDFHFPPHISIRQQYRA